MIVRWNKSFGKKNLSTITWLSRYWNIFRTTTVTNAQPSRNAETEAKILTWIASLTGAVKGDRESFENFLHDGVVLCTLINRLAPGSVKKIGKKSEAAAMENINAFRAAAKVIMNRATSVVLLKQISRITSILTTWLINRRHTACPKWKSSWHRTFTTSKISPRF